MKFFMLISVLLLCGLASAKDLSESFQDLYDNDASLSDGELEFLQDKEVVFVPGILSEVFTRDDQRGRWDFSRLTTDYFSAQMNALLSIGVRVSKIRTSSSSIQTTKSVIKTTLKRLKAQNQKAIFVTHSLGGLALLDYLIAQEQQPDSIVGIIFVQTPFYGSPIADVYKANPYYIKTLLKPFMPFFNTNFETIQSIGVENRSEYMENNDSSIKALTRKIPMLTVSSTSFNNKSIFRPAMELMAFGCLKQLFGRCITKTLYHGPYDESDGMVPFKNSLLPDVDFIKLYGVDHGEMVIKIPYTDYSKSVVPEVLLKMLIQKINSQL